MKEKLRGARPNGPYGILKRIVNGLPNTRNKGRQEILTYEDDTIYLFNKPVVFDYSVEKPEKFIESSEFLNEN